MRLAINICLWALVIASGIMFGVSESATRAHGWHVVFIGSMVLSVAWSFSVRIGRILSIIEQVLGTVGPDTDQSQILKDLELVDHQARKMKQIAWILLVMLTITSGWAILGRWLNKSDGKVIRADLFALYSLLLTIQGFAYYPLQRRLVALYRQLAQAPKEEESGGSE